MSNPGRSTWTSTAMNPGGAFTNRLAYIEIRYGTDPLLHPSGFDYDQVTVTNFDDVVPDTLPNTCIAQGVAPAAGGEAVEPTAAPAATRVHHRPRRT